MKKKKNKNTKNKEDKEVLTNNCYFALISKYFLPV